MSYNEWISMTINCKNFVCGIKNANLIYGKFYVGAQDQEVSADSINRITIQANNSAVVSASGREDSPSGAEGSIDLYDVNGDGKPFAHIYWDCPWSGDNKFTYQLFNDNYLVDKFPFVSTSGEIGNVSFRVGKF